MDARTVFSWALVTVLAAVTWLLAAPFLSWLLAAGLLAFLLFPVHRRVEERVGPRLSAGLLTLLVVAVVVALLTVGANAAVSRAVPLLEGVTEAQTLRRFEALLERYAGMSLPIQSLARQAVDRATAYASESASTVLRRGLHAFVGFLLLTFVLYYLLKDGRRFVGWLRSVVPLAPDVSEKLFDAVRDMTWAVLEGHVLVAAVQGAVAGVSLFVTGVPEAALLTVAMMFLAIVPIVGVAPILGGAVVFLFLNGRPLSAAFVLVWGMTTVAVTDDYLRAYIIDRESTMHSAVIFVGVVGGTYLLGAMGLFVGPILVGLFKTTVEVLGEHYAVIDRR